MQTFEERMKTLIDSVAGNANKFALSLGAERANMIYKVLKGETLPSLETIFRIKKVYPQINLEWLLNGDGEMFVTESQPQDKMLQPNEVISMVTNQREKVTKNIEASFYEKMLQDKESMIIELKQDKEFLKGLVITKLEKLGKLLSSDAEPVVTNMVTMLTTKHAITA